MPTLVSKKEPADGDLVTDWIDYDYKENGYSFIVTHLKSQTFSKPLSEEGPFEKLTRNGRFLHPCLNLYNSNIPFIVRPEMFAQQRAQLRFRNSDIVICAYPRCGCTWMEQLILLLLSKGDPSSLNTAEKNVYNPLRPERNGKVYIETLFGSGDLAAPWGTLVGQDRPMTSEDVDAIRHRRIFKTHYAARMLPGFGEHPDRLEKGLLPPIESIPGVKYIVIVRDPKDVCVSFHRLNALPMNKHGMPFTAYSRLFVQGRSFEPWNDFLADYFALAEKHADQFIIVPYEDNRSDPLTWARRMATFLGLELTEEELASAVRYSSFDSMKEMSKGAAAEHVHKGSVGGWKDLMKEDMVQLYNDMVMDERLGEYGRRYYVPGVGPSNSAES